MAQPGRLQPTLTLLLLIVSHLAFGFSRMTALKKNAAEKIQPESFDEFNFRHMEKLYHKPIPQQHCGNGCEQS
jgi:hypothetical protein